MRKFLSRMWHEQDGVLSFEWTMLASLLTVGVVTGVSSLRDGMIDEMGDLTRAMTSLDQSYRVQGPLVISVHTPDFGSGNAGSYRVYNYRGGTTRASTQGGSVMSYTGSTAAGSIFIDTPSQISTRRLPEQKVPADGPVPGTPVPPEAQDSGDLPGYSLDQ
jgi:Flp pilus assembly pilin Flp